MDLLIKVGMKKQEDDAGKLFVGFAVEGGASFHSWIYNFYLVLSKNII